MYYLVPLFFLFLAWIAYVPAERYNLKVFTFILKMIIIVSAVLFVYLYAAYRGYDALAYGINWFKENLM